MAEARSLAILDGRTGADGQVDRVWAWLHRHRSSPTLLFEPGGFRADFAGKWRVGAHIVDAPDGFRSAANAVLKALYDRIQKENRELYPAAERL